MLFPFRHRSMHTTRQDTLSFRKIQVMVGMGPAQSSMGWEELSESGFENSFWVLVAVPIQWQLAKF